VWRLSVRWARLACARLFYASWHNAV
jgi:hypothetical protein